ncbi:sigma-70 family RNA polymerase sigma factor [Actinoplanes sp. NPDC024001]|uniref:sigma-70 family RNA polymerase sigma factor n=1 Tax=Actinoplanes sp. NPDC024001 TaxID=3154598 RepID=UPI0033F5EDA5
MPVEPQTAVSRADTAREDFDEVAERYARERGAGDAVRDRRLRDEMICAVLPMAERLAAKYRGRSEPLADLEQVARLGLVKAVDRYDPLRGSFTAYAVQTIVGELKRHLRDHAWAVHVPRRMQEMALAVTHHEAELTRELGREPTEAEVAAKAGLAADELKRARLSTAGYRSLSLNTPIGDGSAQVGDLFGDLDGALEKVADQLTVAEMMARLPERERHIVVSTFYGGRTQSDIAAQLGVSQMHVSRMLSRVLSWMRAGLLTDRIPRWPAADDPALTPFEVEFRLVSGVLEIAVGGEVDRDNADRLRTALLDLVCRQPSGQRVVLRLDRVPLLDAAGVRVLLNVYEAAQARGVTVTAAGLSPMVRKIATVAGLTSMLAAAEGAPE